MRDYARMSPTFWTRGTGKRLRGDMPAQILAMYLMTAPQGTMTGIFQMTVPSVCAETGLSAEAVMFAFARLEREDFASYDQDAEVVFVHTAIVWQVGKRLKAEDKRVTGIIRELESIGQHRFVTDFVSKYGESHALGEMFSQAPSKPLASPIEGPSEPLRSQAQAQAQAQAQEGAGAPMPAPAPTHVPTRTRESAHPGDPPTNGQTREILDALRSLPALAGIANAATADALYGPVMLGKWAMADIRAGLEDYAEVHPTEVADGRGQPLSVKRARNFVQRAWADRCAGKVRPSNPEPEGQPMIQVDNTPPADPAAVAAIMASMAGAGMGGSGAAVKRPGARA